MVSHCIAGFPLQAGAASEGSFLPRNTSNFTCSNLDVKEISGKETPTSAFGEGRGEVRGLKSFNF